MAFIDLPNVEVIDETSSDAKMLVVENGEIKRAAMPSNDIKKSELRFKNNFQELYLDNESVSCAIAVLNDDNNDIRIIEVVQLLTNFEKIKDVIESCDIYYEDDYEICKFIPNSYGYSKRNDTDFYIDIYYGRGISIRFYEGYPE